MRAYAGAFAILTFGFAGNACAQPYYNGVPLPPPGFQMPSGSPQYLPNNDVNRVSPSPSLDQGNSFGPSPSLDQGNSFGPSPSLDQGNSFGPSPSPSPTQLYQDRSNQDGAADDDDDGDHQ